MPTRFMIVILIHDVIWPYVLWCELIDWWCTCTASSWLFLTGNWHAQSDLIVRQSGIGRIHEDQLVVMKITYEAFPPLWERHKTHVVVRQMDILSPWQHNHTHDMTIMSISNTYILLYFYIFQYFHSLFLGFISRKTSTKCHKNTAWCHVLQIP